MSKIFSIMRTKVILLLLISVLCLNSYASKGSGKVKIHGTVKDVGDNPVNNALILADGATTGSMTNARGQYVVKVSRDAQSIGVIAPGNIVDADLIDGRTRIDFKLNRPVRGEIKQSDPGDEPTGLGYGSIEKKFVTTDLTRIDGNKEKYASYTSVDEMIVRECSGVRGNNGSFIIQNAANLKGPVPALLIVDGTYVDNLNGITPTSVESISILKGTSATIYGSRGYGGAIVITTKK
jgi:TonB-dependent SusC/RagA subfamily outer membrane receptor